MSLEMSICLLWRGAWGTTMWILTCVMSWLTSPSSWWSAWPRLAWWWSRSMRSRICSRRTKMPTHLLRVSSLAVNVKVEGEERNKLEDIYGWWRKCFHGRGGRINWNIVQCWQESDWFSHSPPFPALPCGRRSSSCQPRRSNMVHTSNTYLFTLQDDE